MTKEAAPKGRIARMIDRFRDHVRAVARRSPWLLAAGLFAAMFALTVALPGFIASQPTFMNRFSNTQKFYSTWNHSTHAEVSCQSCHIKPDRLSQLAFNARMVGEFYLSVVSAGRRPTLFKAPPNAACANCHGTNRTVSPSGDLKIPHRAHVIVLKLACVHCHKYVVHFKNPEGTHTPRMATCLVCHDGKKAKNACTSCHKKKTFPVSHRSATWLVIHPSQTKKVDCRSCHGWVKAWCRECHERKPRSHGDRWRTLHQYKVRARRNCEACHPRPFCVRCHGEVPQLNIEKAPKFVQ